ncbi:hypothetical protein GCM10023328_02260 [Modestobacter marinus]|uniref:Uncharacterized protein n=1 Tax=Modestobacter marinus TaxID=477641 RepID=A0A846LPQ9_9ACTN|nr:hypothetical protein [Modestobacter marinus]NIH67348.1 hypothetical protein [Modestobacter marinus]GGL54132.1 hypothetical protein GCM10011589_07700 [Modestobacter marinus]
MSAPGPRRPWLYDPSAGGRAVRAHRPPSAGAVDAVVSDALWTDVLRVVRWATATLDCRPELVHGTAWRTAAASAGLLRRLRGLCAEVGLVWPGFSAVDPDGPARGRLRAATGRLSAHLSSPGQDVLTSEGLAAVAADVDAVGAAAVALLAEEADRTVCSRVRAAAG